MAKAKHRTHASGGGSGSAAQRREGVREQRQQRLGNDQKPQQSRRSQARAAEQRRAARRTWFIVGGVIVALVAVVAIFIVIAQQNNNTPSTAGRSPSDPTVLKQVTSVSASVSSQVGTGGVTSNLQATQGSPALLKGPNGKPEVFYSGAEFCPFCAGQRWAMVVALSRFGTFTDLPLTHSSSRDVYPNTATFSFYQSQYSSSTVDFVPVEQYTNQSDGNGYYTPLQTPTTDQANLIKTYNAPPYTSQQSAGGFPFISIGNRYLVIGPTYIPDVLANMTQQQIASQLSDANSNVTKKIVGAANYLTAAICAITQNQPASACSAAPIPQLEQSLPKPTALNSHGPQVALIEMSHDMILPRQD